MKQDSQQNGRLLLCQVLFMLSVTNKSFMLSVIMLNVIMLSVIRLSVNMLIDIYAECYKLAQ